LDLLQRHPEATLLAGGQSLVPLMKLRLATPARLVDIGGIRDMSYVREERGHIAVGALTRHAELAENALIAQAAPLLGNAAAHVGDPQIRRWGTFGGSLCHADPGADLAAVALAQDVVLVVTGPRGERTIPIHEWFVGSGTTALRSQEILREIRIRPTEARAGWAFVKFTRRAIDPATVGVAVQCTDGSPRVALMNMGDRPLRATAVEAALAGGASHEVAARAAADGMRPISDAIATGAYRRKLASVLTKRALIEAAARAEIRQRTP
jgi:carbon-monoxide dehydrogenase medium subunit